MANRRGPEGPPIDYSELTKDLVAPEPPGLQIEGITEPAPEDPTTAKTKPGEVSPETLAALAIDDVREIESGEKPADLFVEKLRKYPNAREMVMHYIRQQQDIIHANRNDNDVRAVHEGYVEYAERLAASLPARDIGLVPIDATDEVELDDGTGIDIDLISIMEEEQRRYAEDAQRPLEQAEREAIDKAVEQASNLGDQHKTLTYQLEVASQYRRFEVKAALGLIESSQRELVEKLVSFGLTKLAADRYVLEPNSGELSDDQKALVARNEAREEALFWNQNLQDVERKISQCTRALARLGKIGNSAAKKDLKKLLRLHNINKRNIEKKIAQLTGEKLDK